MIPRFVFLTKGAGKHREQLTSFEIALRKASIACYNLVNVSSIFPPKAKLISKEKGIKLLKPGEIVHCVLAKNSTNEPHRTVAASIGLAIPKDPTTHGYLSEYHGFGVNTKKAGDYAEDLAAEMLATVLGLEFNPESSWDEKKEIWRMSGKIIRTRNISQASKGPKNGDWVTVIAAAVFIL